MKSIPENEMQGSMLLELTVSFPFLLTLIAGVVNICSLLWTAELAEDAVRYGAGNALYYSEVAFNASANQHTSCSEIKETVEREIEDYLKIVMSASQQAIWAKPQVRFFTKLSGAVPGAPPTSTNITEGINTWWVEVKLGTAEDRSNCLFCFEHLLDYVGYTAKSSYALRSNSQLRCSL